MKRTTYGRGASKLLCLLLLLVLTACTGMQTREQSSVEKRAQERLDLIFAGNLGAAYEYLSPGYRSGISSLDWQRAFLSRKVQWESGQITSSECEEDVCKVQIRMKFSVYAAVPGAGRVELDDMVTENWIRSEEQWYLVP